ncbi:MAG: glycosyltransferase family 9 protein [Candidatus Competibacteraceae bacterium]
MPITPNKVLIFRPGSLGDTVVALPAFHLIARAYPNAERRVLTHLPFGIGNKETPISAVLGDAGLVHGYVSYPPGSRATRLQLLWEIRRWCPDVLIHLMGIPCSFFQLLRHEFFFRLCGIKTIIGLPYKRQDRTYFWLPDRGIFESEASRLVRNLAVLGEIDLEDPSNWDLKLTDREKAAANSALQGWSGRSQFLACSIGTKMQVNEWGEDRWIEWIQRMAAAFPKLGLVLIGSSDEFERCERMAALWNGPSINLCGRLLLRESAAVLAEACLFVGHNSGPMHLSAAVGTLCVIVDSGRHKPGYWFPQGRKHKIIYHTTECFGCELEVCVQQQKKCIRSISADEVFETASALLFEARKDK